MFDVDCDDFNDSFTIIIHNSFDDLNDDFNDHADDFSVNVEKVINNFIELSFNFYAREDLDAC